MVNIFLILPVIKLLLNQKLFLYTLEEIKLTMKLKFQLILMFQYSMQVMFMIKYLT